jgi:acetyl esterase
MLDPDISRLLATVFARPPTMPPDVAALRAAAEAAPKLLGGEPEPVEDVRDASIAAGARGVVPIRIYRPAARAPVPALLFAHGGGWVTGSLESHDRLCRQLASRLRALVVAVDYARAPEHRYPAALEDVHAAWNWLRREAAMLGADAGRLVVGGDSSGGNLAAALALRLRHHGAPQPAAQFLLYPAVDRRAQSPSYDRYAEGYNLTAAMMRWYWQAYDPAGLADDPELSPLAAGDLAGLAPAVVAVAATDVLHDEGFAYAGRLRERSVPLRLVACDGMIHGFLRWTGAVPAARAHVEAICAALRDLLDTPLRS